MPETTTKKDTRAGNYFITNYPPYSFWSEDQNDLVEEVYATAHEGTPPPLGLYHHVPFCRKRCHFCYFKVYTGKSASEIHSYLDSTLVELERMTKTPLVGDRKPEFVYFGGGTPSYLSPKQLGSLTDRMKSLLSWDEAKEVAFECEPGTLNKAKLQAIKDIGVTRLSMGVENFDDRILELNGRAHRSKEVMRAYEMAMDQGFEQVNIDLIAGMMEETEENWQRVIEQTVAMQPDSVTLYQMEIPYNTGIYREMKQSGNLIAPIAGWETKRRWVKEAFAALEAAGYTVNSGYSAVKKPETTFLYRDALWEGADMLGLGVASISHVKGMHYQNVPDIEDYQTAVAAGDWPVKRSFRTTPEERMLREFILQMKLGHVRFDYFKNKFGVNLQERFAGELGQLQSEGLLNIKDGEILLTRDGLLCVDNLLVDFFLPIHQSGSVV